MITEQQFSEFISRRYGFSWQQVISDDRHDPLPFLRMLLGIYYRRYMSTSEAGRILRRDHSTVVGYPQRLKELLPFLSASERDIMDSFNCFVAAWDPQHSKVLPVDTETADSVAGVLSQGEINIVLTAHEDRNTMVIMSRWQQVRAEDLSVEQLDRVLALVHIAHSSLLKMAQDRE